MKLYQEWAWLWSDVTPSKTYVEEAQDLLSILCDALGRMPQTILELGAGGGFLLHDLQTLEPSVNITLVDSSPEMLAEASKRNPNAEIMLGDMTTLELGRTFDVVLLHDAVMYLENRDAVSKVLGVMYSHCKADGVAIVVPDCCTETFEERILTAQSETERASIHLTEWHWDADPTDDRVHVEFSVLMRQSTESNPQIESHHETHTMLVLSLGDWMEIFMRNDWMQDFPSQPWMHGGEFFLLRAMEKSV